MTRLLRKWTNLGFTRSYRRQILLLLGILLLFSQQLALVVEAAEDLYQILGVSKTATIREIKQAYRRKALDTHPDKNRGREEEAAKEFQKVVHAFEILSDEASRKRYDRTGRTDAQQSFGNSGQSGGSSWTFRWSSGGSSHRRYSYARPKLKDKFQVKEAQSRILHIVSLEQLETVMVDDDERVLERNLLIVFYTPKLETHLMDEMVFPYPFAGNSDQGVWWETMLQTASVRFHKSNKLCEFFQIPSGDQLEKPVFLFGRRGQPFETSTTWSRIETTNRAEFEEWVWERIKVTVRFVNGHDHPAEVYWIHGTRGSAKMVLQPGEEMTHSTRLSHEWWVRDARTDTHRDSPGRWKLADNTMLIKWKITSDEENQRLVIPRRTCYDLSGHCSFWDSRGECQKNPNFMNQQCMKTCGICSAESEQTRDEHGDEL
eukprot:Nitzschia sp. Nitz4//scaffold24_size164493//14812//16104//NITZ4_002307-RA/size164493-processed-gene-0.219-mRNA-1//-1//CDS//3329544051//6509//frame0